MADDTDDERFRQHEEILRSLTAMLAAQHEMNQRVEGSLQRLETFNHQQVEINQDIKTTLARIETLLTRLIRPADNGRGV